MVEHFRIKFGDRSCSGSLSYRAEKQTDRHTDKRRWKPYPCVGSGSVCLISVHFHFELRYAANTRDAARVLIAWMSRKFSPEVDHVYELTSLSHWSCVRRREKGHKCDDSLVTQAASSGLASVNLSVFLSCSRRHIPWLTRGSGIILAGILGDAGHRCKFGMPDGGEWYGVGRGLPFPLREGSVDWARPLPQKKMIFFT